MKKYILLSLILAICLTLCACSDNSPFEENSTAPSTSVTTALNGEEATNETVSDVDGKEPAQTEKDGSKATESVTDKTETETIPKETETEKKAVETEVETVNKTEATKPPVTTTTPSETKTPPTTEKAETTTPTETKKPEETTDTEEIVIVRPTAAEVSEKVVQYLNQFRSEQGTAHAAVLPGLTQIAEYRSKQLVTNFAHDTLDEREALAYYQYGKYVDMTKHGFDESYNYYTYGGGEAIAKGNWGGTADEIALKIATGFRNSSGHWSYVGGAEYNYIAVGCTYDPSSCSWYCCVLVSIENYG